MTGQTPTTQNLAGKKSDGAISSGSSKLSTEQVDRLWRFALAWIADSRLLHHKKPWQRAAQRAVTFRELPTPQKLDELHVTASTAVDHDIWHRFCSEVGNEIHVGNWLRWLALLRVVVMRLTSKSRREADQKDSWLESLRVHFLEFSKSSKSYGMQPDHGLSVLLGKYNSLPIRRGCPALTYNELIAQPAPLGRDPHRAALDFHDWLLAGALPLCTTPEPLAAKVAFGPALDLAEEAVVRLLSDDANASPVVNICCKNLDLTQPVVEHVIASLARKELEPLDGFEVARQAVIVIPVRTEATPDGKPGRMLAPADALAQIASAFRIPVQIDILRQSDRAFRDVLNQVRRACTLFSGVLIFTGLDVFRGRHSTLLALMRGRRWPAFIRTLIQIHWQTALDYRMAKPTGAKVLVVSNAPIDSLDQWCGAPLLLDAPSNEPSVEWRSMLRAGLGVLAEPPTKVDLLRVVMLAFCACSPDGISYGALRRGMGHWLDLTDRVSDNYRAKLADHAMSVKDKVGFAELMRSQSVEVCVAELLKLFPEYLLLSIDEPLPWVHEPRVQYEWRANAGAATFAELQTTASHIDQNAKLHFRDEFSRRRFIEQILTGEAPPPSGWPHGVVLGDRLWRLVNLAIAIQALNQASAQMLSFSGREPHKVDSVRRVVQTIYHLRAAGNLVITAERGGLEEYAAYLSVPKSPAKRFRYAYAFCYKKLVEGGADYRMARSYARHDIKLALVALFLVDDVRKLEHDDVADEKAFVDALEAGYARWKTDTELPGHDLVPDIITSLAIAAVDAGDAHVAEWALQVMEESRDQILAAPALVWSGDVQDHGRLLDRWRDGIGSDHARLRFDLLDATGQIDEALDHCRAALIELGMAPEFLNLDPAPAAPALSELRSNPVPNDELPTWIATALRTHGQTLKKDNEIRLNHQMETLLKQAMPKHIDGPAVHSRQSSPLRPGWIAKAVDTYLQGQTESSVDLRLHNLERLLGDALDRHIAARHGNRRQRTISDLLARYGDILATHADLKNRETHAQERLRGLLDAFGALWLADRIRSHCAGKSGYGVTWAMLSAKPNRVYVRTALAVARALASMAEKHKEARAGGAEGANMHAALRAAARDFMSHAAHRRDVYVRHLHPHRREALHGLLLSTSVARTWHAVAEPLELDLRHGPTGHELALNSLEEAEGILHELGVPLEVARRVWVERISLFVRGANDAARTGDEQLFSTLSALIERDLRIAYKLALTETPAPDGTPPAGRSGVAAFWGPLVDRQWSRWARQEKRVQARQLL